MKTYFYYAEIYRRVSPDNPTPFSGVVESDATSSNVYLKTKTYLESLAEEIFKSDFLVIIKQFNIV